MLRRFRYLAEGLCCFLVYGLFYLLPLGAASWTGGTLLRLFGRFFKVNRYADKNLQLAFPDWDSKKRRQTILDMWENIGRTIGEFPHVPRFEGALFDAHVEITGKEHLALHSDVPGMLVVSAHMGNWELAPRSAAALGKPMTVVYRPPNNPWVEWLIRLSRRKSHIGLFAKGNESGRQLIKALKSNQHVAMLVDQKMNTGMSLPFFGHNAMTATGVADLHLKYKSPIVMARIIRIKGAYFKAELLPPLTFELTGNHDDDRRIILTAINKELEEWIREYPTQWLWIHRRWPKELYN